MIVNTKVRYGVRTMIEIALHPSETGILQKDIAVNQDISVKYLDQIISGLKIAGLVSTVSGKKTGYKLTKDPSEITVYDIWRAVQPEICIIDCLSQNISCGRERECNVKHFWRGLNSLIINYLSSTTLRELIDNKVDICHIENLSAGVG